MRRIMLLLVLSSIISVSLFASDEEATYSFYVPATLSFTADMHSIFGFSTTPVETAIRPDRMDEELRFRYDGQSTLQTDTFYVYYQIFTTDKVAISLSVTPDEGNDGSITWSNVYGGSLDTFSSSSESGIDVYADSGDVNTNSPRIDSVPLMLRIDEKSLTNVDWNKEYSWTLKLSIRSNG